MVSEEKKYIKFLKQFVLIFVLFYGLVAVFNYVIDPAGMNDFKPFNIEFEKVSFTGSDRLTKVVDYSKAPTPGILIGDSRVKYTVDSKYVEEISGEDYFNFGMTGETINEMIALFWFAAKEGQLKDVYIFISFTNICGRYKTNKVDNAVKLMKSKPAYYTSYFSTSNSIKILRRYLNTRNVGLENAQIDEVEEMLAQTDRNWTRILNGYTNENLMYFNYPHQLFKELETIKEYCQENHINLVFVIPPTNIELQENIIQHDLAKENERFKNDLSRISTTIDFDFPNEWTTSRENFNDPVHFNYNISRKLVKEIWADKLEVGRLLPGKIPDQGK